MKFKKAVPLILWFLGTILIMLDIFIGSLACRVIGFMFVIVCAVVNLIYLYKRETKSPEQDKRDNAT